MRSLRGGVAAGLALALPLGASALSLLPNPLEIDQADGVQSELLLVEVVSGLPAGGVAHLGSVSPGSLTLVFGASLDPGSAPPGSGLSLALRDAQDLALFPSAAGSVPGLDADWVILGLSQGEATFVPGTTLAGTVFDRIFLSYDVPVAADGSLRLLAHWGAPGDSASATLVPEPSTACLLALGLAGLARRVRRSA